MMNGVRKPFYLYRRKSLFQTLQYVARNYGTVMAMLGNSPQCARSRELGGLGVRTFLRHWCIRTWSLFRRIENGTLRSRPPGQDRRPYFHISRILAATLTRICASGCEAKG